MPAEDQITVHHNPANHRFEVQMGDQLALADYWLHGNVIVFTHTEVPEAFRGQGVAARLAKAGLTHAREHGYRVIPKCPFFAEYIRRHREYSDLVTEAP